MTKFGCILFLVIFRLCSCSILEAAQQPFSSFAGDYECLLFDGNYSDSISSGGPKNISDCPDGIICRGKLRVTISQSGAFTASAEYIDSKPVGVLANTVLTESGTLRIPATEDFTAGVKMLRDVSLKKVSFKGVLKTINSESAEVDTTKKTTVSGGDYGLNFKVSLEDLTSLFSPASSKHPKIAVEFIDRNALKDLNRPSYVSKGNGFISVPKNLATKLNPHPKGTYVCSGPAPSDPEFLSDLSEGATMLLRTAISSLGLATTNFSLGGFVSAGSISTIANKLIPLSGRLRMDSTFTYYSMSSIDNIPGSRLENTKGGAAYRIIFQFASTNRLIKPPTREFELLLGTESYFDDSCLLKSKSKYVMSNETNFEWRIGRGVAFDDTSNPMVSVDPTKQGEGLNDYYFDDPARSILLSKHKLYTGAGKYSLIIGNPASPLVKYELNLNAKGALTNATFVSSDSWTISGANKNKALKFAFDPTKGEINGTLRVAGNFYQNPQAYFNGSTTTRLMSKQITLFGGIYDQPADLFIPGHAGRVVAIGNANPYAEKYFDLGPAWILIAD
jgi:hypothetical protein